MWLDGPMQRDALSGAAPVVPALRSFRIVRAGVTLIGMSRRSAMTARWYKFEAVETTTAAGDKVEIPGGIHAVARNSLVYSVQLGGRVVDLTLAEFERLERAGRVQTALGPPSRS